MQVIRILTDGNSGSRACCAWTWRRDGQRPSSSLFSCKNVIYATGGPAGMYADSVYPRRPLRRHRRSHLEAGVRGKNLTEWQYGLASVQPRWNVSGTYMQVLPPLCSTDAQTDRTSGNS